MISGKIDIETIATRGITPIMAEMMIRIVQRNENELTMTRKEKRGNVIDTTIGVAAMKRTAEIITTGTITQEKKIADLNVIEMMMMIRAAIEEKAKGRGSHNNVIETMITGEIENEVGMKVNENITSILDATDQLPLQNPTKMIGKSHRHQKMAVQENIITSILVRKRNELRKKSQKSLPPPVRIIQYCV